MPRERTDEELLYAEEHFVHAFGSRATTLGYEIPWDSAEIRDHDLAPERHDGTNFPNPKLRGLYALAQHYGVPTRLLDWTTRPFTAVYFAAIGAARRVADGKELDRFAVWALSRGFTEEHCHARDPGVVVVTVPKTSNPNLNLQAGLFTLVRWRTLDAMDCVNQEVSTPPPLDALFRQQSFDEEASQIPNLVHLPMLYKFTLPASLARFALHYISLSGVDASTIYAGHGSIVDAMKEPGVRSVCTPSATKLWRENERKERERHGE